MGIFKKAYDETLGYQYPGALVKKENKLVKYDPKTDMYYDPRLGSGRYYTSEEAYEEEMAQKREEAYRQGNLDKERWKKEAQRRSLGVSPEPTIQYTATVSSGSTYSTNGTINIPMPTTYTEVQPPKKKTSLDVLNERIESVCKKARKDPVPSY